MITSSTTICRNSFRCSGVNSSKSSPTLGDNAETPTYIFTELRVGYRMPKGEAPKREET